MDGRERRSLIVVSFFRAFVINGLRPCAVGLESGVATSAHRARMLRHPLGLRAQPAIGWGGEKSRFCLPFLFQAILVTLRFCGVFLGAEQNRQHFCHRLFTYPELGCKRVFPPRRGRDSSPAVHCRDHGAAYLVCFVPEGTDENMG